MQGVMAGVMSAHEEAQDVMMAPQREEPAFQDFNFSFQALAGNVFQNALSAGPVGRKQSKRSFGSSRSPGTKSSNNVECVEQDVEVQEPPPEVTVAPIVPTAPIVVMDTRFLMDPDAPSFLDKLPTPILQKILFLLDDPRRVTEELLDPRVMLAEEERKLSRSMVNLMLTCKAVYRAGMKRGGVTTARPIFYAVSLARRGERERLDELLQTIGARVQTQALLDRALIESCTTAAAERVCGAAALLLDAGASPRAESFYGRPVHVAARRGHLELLRLLLDRGADPTEPDGVGFTAMQCAVNSGNEELGRTLQEWWETMPRKS